MAEDAKKQELTDAVGGIGVYQVIVILLALHQTSVLGSLGSFAQFLAPNVNLQWRSHNHTDNTTVFQSTNCHFQSIWDEQRELYDANVSTSLVYTSDFSRKSLTEQLNLVCERSWLVSLSKSVTLIGFLFGNVLFGVFSERIGRRWLSIVSLFPAAIANACILFNINYIMYVISCFILGVSVPCIAQGSYVIMLEILPTRLRPWFACFTSYGFLIGQCINIALAWIFDDWFYVHLSYAIFTILPCIFTWYVSRTA